MKYTVHLYYAVQIRMGDIEADSQEEAFKKARNECNASYKLACREAEYDETPPLGAWIDEEGDEEYLNTRYHEGDGAKLYLSVEGGITK